MPLQEISLKRAIVCPQLVSESLRRETSTMTLDTGSVCAVEEPPAR